MNSTHAQQRLSPTVSPKRKYCHRAVLGQLGLLPLTCRTPKICPENRMATTLANFSCRLIVPPANTFPTFSVSAGYLRIRPISTRQLTSASLTIATSRPFHPRHHKLVFVFLGERAPASLISYVISLTTVSHLSTKALMLFPRTLLLPHTTRT